MRDQVSRRPRTPVARFKYRRRVLSEHSAGALRDGSRSRRVHGAANGRRADSAVRFLLMRRGRAGWRGRDSTPPWAHR